MVDQIETNTARRSDPSPDINSDRSTSIRTLRQANRHPVGDDVIVSLADAYENQRARQVTQWEQMYRHAGQTVA